MTFSHKAILPMRYLILAAEIVFLSFRAEAQTTQSLSIQECYTLANQNYPLTKQHDLIKSSEDYSVTNISFGYLPKITVSGQATYQSDVTKIPISFPGLHIPELSKDQYKLAGEISEPLTDLITVHQQGKLQEVNSSIQEENLDTELFKLKDRINQLFFGALLLDEQIDQNNLLKKDIQTGIASITAGISNGVNFKTDLDKLNAELLKANQRGVELQSSRNAYAAMLSLFINKSIDSTTVLEKPEAPSISKEIHRPELVTFDSQRKSYDIQDNLVLIKNLPKFELFFQEGVGKPSPVNLFSTDWSSYYYAGISLNWSLSNLYTFSNEWQINEINRKMVDAQKETFLFNTNLALRQQQEEITKLQKLLSSDDAIVDLQVAIKTTSKAQLENGVITANDFLKAINAEDEARQNRVLHEVQLLIAEYNYQNTSGNQ